MAAKLSKAKRPKRRWIGISFPSSIRSRRDVELLIKQRFSDDIHFRLYDAHFHGSDVVNASCEFQSIKDDIGLGIICVNLVDYDAVREMLSKSSTNGRMNSLSSSGKYDWYGNVWAFPNPRRSRATFSPCSSWVFYGRWRDCSPFEN